MRRLNLSECRCLLPILVLLLAVAPAWGQDAPRLLTLTGPGVAPVGTIDAAVDSRRAEVAAEVLDARPQAIDLELIDGALYRALATDIERRGPGDVAWRGHLAGNPDAQVSLTLKNGYVLGLIYTPEAVYELRTTADGGQELAQLDQERFPGCANATDSAAVAGAVPAPPVGRSLDTPSRIDVMTLYTPQARDAAGGVAAIEATIQAAIDDSNTSFINSNMEMRFNLVHIEMANYNDTGDIFTDRNWLGSDATVAALRDQYRADLVGLIVNTSGFCGVAFLMGNEDPAAFSESAFQVTVRGCAVGNHSFTHEHGHNMGMQHDPANGASPANAIYNYAYGHFVNGSYRTVMSYSNQCSQGCTRVNQISNPDVTFNGVPTGLVDQRNNYLTGQQIGPFTANYRTADLVFDDGFESGNLSSWSN